MSVLSVNVVSDLVGCKFILDSCSGKDFILCFGPLSGHNETLLWSSFSFVSRDS